MKHAATKADSVDVFGSVRTRRYVGDICSILAAYVTRFLAEASLTHPFRHARHLW